MTSLYSPVKPSEIILSSELDGLVNGANAISAEFENSTSRDLMCNIGLQLAETLARLDNHIDVYILPEIDGIYVTGDATLTPESKYFVGSFTLDLVVDPRVSIITDVRLPNSEFKVLVQNNMGVDFSAVGSIIKLERYNYEYV